MEITTLLGLILGIGGIVLGHIVEGGHLGSLIQFTAGLIVFGGTLGAVLISHPLENIRTAARLLKWAFVKAPMGELESVSKQIVEAAMVARKESILALEKRIPQFTNPYMQTVFKYVIDGIDPQVIKDVFENEISLQEEKLNLGAKVYADAGGFSPTIGIIGAVLGLIHVMENLSDTAKLGSGIAVAFVATVYGVGAANLILFPISNKIKNRVKEEALLKELILTGALGVVNGLNPFIIEERLRSFIPKSQVR